MVLATSDPKVPEAARRGPAFGPAVWGWGLVGGLALWGLGFLHLPWWAALLLWWWPSVLFGAAVALLAIGLAKWLARVIERRHGAARNRGEAEPSG